MPLAVYVRSTSGEIIRQGFLIRRKKKENPPPQPHPSTHHQINSSTAIATKSRGATKQVPRVSPSSTASVDAKFVEIGYIQLSLSMIQGAGRQYSTDRQTN